MLNSFSYPRYPAMIPLNLASASVNQRQPYADELQGRLEQ
jgi:hypothetical protein